MFVEVVTTGSELLLGEIVNENSRYLSRELNALGYSVIYHTTVGDNPERMEGVLRTALQRADIVITTGGLGPVAVGHQSSVEGRGNPGDRDQGRCEHAARTGLCRADRHFFFFQDPSQKGCHRFLIIGYSGPVEPFLQFLPNGFHQCPRFFFRLCPGRYPYFHKTRPCIHGQCRIGLPFNKIHQLVFNKGLSHIIYFHIQ